MYLYTFFGVLSSSLSDIPGMDEIEFSFKVNFFLFSKHEKVGTALPK